MPSVEYRWWPTLRISSIALLGAVIAGGCQDGTAPPTADPAVIGGVLAQVNEKTAVCHAAGRGDDPKFVEVRVNSGALAAHMDANGTPRAGHEGDYLVTPRTPCPPPPPTAPNVRICKAVNTDILLSRFFAFDVNGETVMVRGSQCADRTFRVGTPVTITETILPGTELFSITITPEAAGTGNVAGASATIIAGTDLAEVIFRNHSLLGQLTICKQVNSSSLRSLSFYFEVTRQGAGPAYYSTPPVNPSAPPPGACVSAGTYPVGTELSVFEQFFPGGSYAAVYTPSITVLPANRVVPGSLNLAGRRVSVTIGEGTTEVRYVNARLVGYLQICNVTPAGFTGTTQFLIDAPWRDGSSPTLSLPANQCGFARLDAQPGPEGFEFPVGPSYPIVIREVVPSGLRLDAVTVDPPDRLSGTPQLTPPIAAAGVTIGTGTTTATFHHVWATP